MTTSPDALAACGSSPGLATSGHASGGRGATVAAATRDPAGLVLTVLCFAVVVAIVAVGLYAMLTSK